jgi:hypothetical protein
MGALFCRLPWERFFSNFLKEGVPQQNIQHFYLLIDIQKILVSLCYN